MPNFLLVITCYLTQTCNLDEVTGKITFTHNLQYPYNSIHPYKILIVGGSRIGTVNALTNLIHEESVIVQRAKISAFDQA